MRRPAENSGPSIEDSSVEQQSKMFRDLLLGFVKIHVLYHAGKEPIFGVGIAAELERHGYHLSPGTLYPLLHNLEAARFLEREDRIVGGKIRKYYTLTPLGRRALAEARAKVVELVSEVTSDDAKPARKPPAKVASAARQAKRPAR